MHTHGIQGPTSYQGPENIRQGGPARGDRPVQILTANDDGLAHSPIRAVLSNVTEPTLTVYIYSQIVIYTHQ